MILTLIKKDLKIFFSDKKGILLAFLLPILLISLFAFAFGGIGGNNETKPLTLLIIDNDKSEASKNMVQKLEDLDAINLVSVEEKEGEERVKKGKNIAALILKEGFSEVINQGDELPMELKYDASREIESFMLQSILTQEIMKDIGKDVMHKNIKSYLNENFAGVNEQLKHKIISDISSANTQSSNGLSKTLQLKTTSIIKEDKKASNFGLVQAVAGTAIMMLLFSITAIGGSLLDEKEAGTFKRLLYSPVKPLDILFGKMGVALILAIVQLVVMFIFAWLAFGLPIFDNILALVLLIVAVSFSVSSFGVFLVSIAKTRQQLNGLSSIIILLMSAIGGSMVPIFVMPEIMQKIAIISVNYWGIQGFYDIFSRHLTLLDVVPRMVVLMTIGTVMILISINLFKRNMMKVS